MRRLEDRMINAKNASDIAIKNQQAFASGRSRPWRPGKVCGRGPACRRRAQSARFATAGHLQTMAVCLDAGH